MHKKFTRRAMRPVGYATAAVAISLANQALAASGNWTGAANDNGIWANPANWADNVPGATNGTFVSPDYVTFAGSVTSSPITIDANRNIAGVIWASQSTMFAVGATGATAPLFLTGGGMSEVGAGSNTLTNPAFNAPLVIEGSTYTFASDATSGTSGLKLNGDLSGGAASIPVVVTLSGVNLVSTTTSNTRVAGNITDGLASSLGIFKTGSGVWEITGAANTYSGNTVINQGLIRFNGTGAMSPNSGIIVNSGGTARFNVSNNTIKSLTMNFGGSASASANAISTNVTGTASGPAIIYDMTAATGAATGSSFTMNLTGTTDRQGGVQLLISDTAGRVQMIKNVNLGSVNRPFDIGASAANTAAGTPDLEVSNQISGAGGIIKMGAGVLKLDGKEQTSSSIGDTFTGPLEIQAGAVRFNATNQLIGDGTNLPALIVNGGTLNVTSFNETFSNATVSSGTLQGSGGTGAVSAASITFPIAAGTTATSSAILLSGPIVKSGGGTLNSSASISADSLTISGGSLSLNSNGANVIVTNSLSISGGAKLDLSDNDLIVNYTGDSPAAAIRSLLAGGFNNGNWDGTGIASKSAHSNAAGTTGLGYAENSDVQIGSIDGVTPGTSSVIVKYTYNGDTNLDGLVDTTDFQRFLDGFAGHGSTWSQGDFTYDGKVDLGNDYNAFLNGYLQQGGSLGDLAEVVNADSRLSGAQKASLLAVVPEPSSLALIGLAGAAMLKRRRQQ